MLLKNLDKEFVIYDKSDKEFVSVTINYYEVNLQKKASKSIFSNYFRSFSMMTNNLSRRHLIWQSTDKF